MNRLEIQQLVNGWLPCRCDTIGMYAAQTTCGNCAIRPVIAAKIRELASLLRRAHESRIERESGSYGSLCDEIEAALSPEPKSPD